MDGAELGPDGSGVSEKPGDRAYSAQKFSSPNALASFESKDHPDTLEELTITAWYKWGGEDGGLGLLWNGFGVWLAMHGNMGDWSLRLRTAPVDPTVDLKQFYSYPTRKPQAGWSPPGEWVFIAMTWKAAIGEVEFFRGSKSEDVIFVVASQRPESIPISIVKQNIGYIGNQQPRVERAFDGQIDNVRFFSKALDLNSLKKIREADLKSQPVLNL
jgi:hypothetical protein